MNVLESGATVRRDDDPDVQVLRNEIRCAVFRAMNQLTPEIRLVVSLALLEGRTYQENREDRRLSGRYGALEAQSGQAAAPAVPQGLHTRPCRLPARFRRWLDGWRRRSSRRRKNDPESICMTRHDQRCELLCEEVREALTSRMIDGQGHVRAAYAARGTGGSARRRGRGRGAASRTLHGMHGVQDGDRVPRSDLEGTSRSDGGQRQNLDARDRRNRRRTCSGRSREAPGGKRDRRGAVTFSTEAFGSGGRARHRGCCGRPALVKDHEPASVLPCRGERRLQGLRAERRRPRHSRGPSPRSSAAGWSRGSSSNCPRECRGLKEFSSRARDCVRSSAAGWRFWPIGQNPGTWACM